MIAFSVLFPPQVLRCRPLLNALDAMGDQDTSTIATETHICPSGDTGSPP
ncbi:MAG TPA: hypothetical protein VER04_22815 [Polyangiaceae bacterium]|nr:hypothetical protein [Polyangiaceae bacterium]